MVMRVKVGEGGRLVIPADVRKRLGIKVGDFLGMDEGETSLTLTSGSAALRRLQKSFEGTMPAGVSIVDELIADRRKEAANE